MRKSTGLALLLGLLFSLWILSSCAESEPPPASGPVLIPAGTPIGTPFSQPGGGYPGPAGEPAAGGYPSPQEPVVSNDQGYPAPGIAPGEPNPGNGGPVVPGTLFVDSVDLVMLESFPLQMMATVRGSFADGCTYYDTYVQTNDGSTIKIELFALRPADMVCTEALAPFDIQVPVDIIGLKAGDYTVEVNESTTASFSLAQDNISVDS